jgi:hypothetical protein
LDSSRRGTVITATPGSIVAIRWLSGIAPGVANGYTAISDSATNPPRLLWGCDFGSQVFDKVAPLSPASIWSNELATNVSIPFNQLFLASIGNGVVLEIDVS